MQKFWNNEYKSVLENRAFRETAEGLVLKCGARADLSGCKCLTDAVILYGTELSTETSDTYRIIGQYRKLMPKSVMRNISYTIKQSFGLCMRLSRMVGIPIPPGEIHNGLVIAYLGLLFRNPNLDKSQFKTDGSGGCEIEEASDDNDGQLSAES